MIEGTDACFLMQFAGREYHWPLNHEQMEENLKDRNSRFFKVCAEGETVGHCQLRRIDSLNKRAAIGRVLISGDFQGRGYGRKMISLLMEYAAEELGLKELSLRVYDFNTAAHSCYKNMGFRDVSREEIHIEEFQETWICINMVKTLKA